MKNKQDNENIKIFALQLVSLVLAASHMWIYVFQDPVDFRVLADFAPIVKSICCVAFIIGVQTKKEQFIRYFFPVYAYLVLYFNRFTNMTSFIIILLSYHRRPKDGVWLFPAYLGDLIVALFLNKALTPAHALIHIFSCLGILILYYMYFYRKSSTIILDQETIAILDQWIELGHLSDLTETSRSTAYRKLDKAVEKNGLKDKEELRDIYINEMRQK